MLRLGLDYNRLLPKATTLLENRNRNGDKCWCQTVSGVHCRGEGNRGSRLHSRTATPARDGSGADGIY
jgi:hypothetical protein